MPEIQTAFTFETIPGNDEHTLAKARRGLRRWETRNRRVLAAVRAYEQTVAALREERKRAKRPNKQLALVVK